MDVDANIIISKLGDQIKQLTITMAIRDAQIEILQAEIAKLSVKE